MVRSIPWTWGVATQVTPASPNWVWPDTASTLRTFPPRIRGDHWVEDGHYRTADPATDTRED